MGILDAPPSAGSSPPLTGHVLLVQKARLNCPWETAIQPAASFATLQPAQARFFALAALVDHFDTAPRQSLIIGITGNIFSHVDRSCPIRYSHRTPES